MRERYRQRDADRGGRRMRGRSQRKGDREPPSNRMPEIAKQRRGQDQQQSDGRGTQRDIDGSKRHQAAQRGEQEQILVEITGRFNSASLRGAQATKQSSISTQPIVVCVVLRKHAKAGTTN